MRREIESPHCLVNSARICLLFPAQRLMAEHIWLNTFLLIALDMSRLLHPSFFSQVHIVNTHVFSIGATFLIHFKDISNTARVHIQVSSQLIKKKFHFWNSVPTWIWTHNHRGDHALDLSALPTELWGHWQKCYYFGTLYT